ncbi:MAG: hypothetical protein WAL75_00880 [Terracidiphilus sp.]
MRLKAAAGAFLSISIGAFGQSPKPGMLAQIPDGVLNGNTYTNQDLAIVFRLPRDWTATVNPKLTTLFNPDADALANRCTRILLEFDSKPGDSTAKGVVFAIDPGCLGIGPFPAAETEKEKLEAFNRSIAEIYNRSTFFPPSGLNLYAFRGSGAKNRLFLGMEGAAVVSPPGGGPGGEAGVKGEPVSMHTLFVLVDVDKCWVGWAIVADDKAKNEFAKESRMTVQ